MNPDLLLKALRKITAAIQGVGHKPVVIGDLARQAWGSKRDPASIRLLTDSGEAQREAILGAARGEGLQQSGGSAPLSFTYTDPKQGGTAAVEVVEAATPFLKQVVGRAQRDAVLQMTLPLAACDDVILLDITQEREAVVELLRINAGRIDPGYLKREAEAAGTFDLLKSAWQEARK